MPRRTFASDLSSDLRQQLNARLRSRGYADILGAASWLQELGVEASKSAVHRYAKALREADGLKEATGHALIARMPVVPSGLGRREEILMELGVLRERELELIDELRTLRDNNPESGSM